MKKLRVKAKQHLKAIINFNVLYKCKDMIERG